MPGGVISRFVAHELEGVLVPQELEARRKFLVAAPEAKLHRQKWEQRQRIADVCAGKLRAAEGFARARQRRRVAVKAFGVAVKQVIAEPGCLRNTRQAVDAAVPPGQAAARLGITQHIVDRQALVKARGRGLLAIQPLDQPRSAADTVGRGDECDIQKLLIQRQREFFRHRSGVVAQKELRRTGGGDGIIIAHGQTPFIVRLMRPRFSSTSSTLTCTTSPTCTTSDGCLMNLLQTCEMCTSPS